MNKRNNTKGFTLIELITVLVILAVVCLIVVPLIMNIINKVKVQAARRSVDAYGHAVELALSTYMLENLTYPESLDDLKVSYSGSNVECDYKELFSNGNIYMTKCRVNGEYVRDTKEVDNYYHYRYGKQYDSYKIGDQVTYKNETYYVIKDSDEINNTVTLLKAEPLTYEFVNRHAPGIIYTGSPGKIGDYAFMAFYARADGTTDSDYGNSDIKKIVDLWQNEYLDINDLVDDDNDGAYARLITTSEYSAINNSTLGWRCNGSWGYWTMTPANESSVFVIGRSCGPYSNSSSRSESVSSAVRPVIVLLKSAL